MSAAYHCTDPDCPLDVITPDTDPDVHWLDLEPSNHALVIGDPTMGALAIEGSPDALRRFAQRVWDAVHPPTSTSPDR